MARHPQEVSITRIAKEGGVSVATVSRVMNRRVGVSEATRDRIDQLLRKYRFTTTYPQSRQPKVAVLIPVDDFNNYIAKALKGIFTYAREGDMEVSLVTRSTHPRTTTLEQIRDQQCAGVIVLLPDYYVDEHRLLAASELPVMFLDAQIAIEGAGFIDNDSYSGSCAATRHLLELGHRRIGFLRYHLSSLNQIQRFKGYENTLKEAGIQPTPAWLAESPAPDRRNVKGIDGLRAMKRLLEQAPDITAVLAVDDEMAFGAITHLHKIGKKIPADISIIGFDNYPETEIWYPALTTVNHPIQLAGYHASKAIKDAIDNPGKWRPPQEILPTRLVVRESTGPARP